MGGISSLLMKNILGNITFGAEKKGIRLDMTPQGG